MNPAMAVLSVPAKNTAAGSGAAYIIPNNAQSGNSDTQSNETQTEVFADFPADILLSSVLAESAETPVSDELLLQEPAAEQPVLQSSSAVQVDTVALHSLTIPAAGQQAEAPVTVLPAVDTEESLTALQQIQQPGSSSANHVAGITAYAQANGAAQNNGMTVAQRWQNEQPAVAAGVITTPQGSTVQPAQTLPVLSLQQFLQQWQNPSQGAGTAITADISTVAHSQQQGLQPANVTTFQWKAESLGQQSASWGQKLLHLLSDKVNLQLGQQIQRAQIRLDPPHLGAIDLSVTVEGDRTTVQLYASNQQVREAMQQHLDQLRQTLSQRMGEEMGIEVSVRQHNEQQADKSFPDNEKIEQQHEIAAVTAETTQAGNKQHSGWLNRLA